MIKRKISEVDSFCLEAIEERITMPATEILILLKDALNKYSISSLNDEKTVAEVFIESEWGKFTTKEYTSIRLIVKSYAFDGDIYDEDDIKYWFYDGVCQINYYESENIVINVNKV